MPPAIQLNLRKTYGFLKPIGPTDKRSDGKVVWKFHCKRCGKTTEKRADHVAREIVRSCGCLQRSVAGSCLPTPAEQKRRHKERQSVIHGQRVFLSLAAAARFLGVADQTAIIWASKCPWRGGAGIYTEPDVDGGGRTVPYYLKDDLLKIKEAKKSRPRIPEIPHHMYVGDLIAELGITQSTLSRRLARLGKVKAKRVEVAGADGQTRHRSYIPHWACEKLGVKPPTMSVPQTDPAKAPPTNQGRKKKQDRPGRPCGQTDEVRKRDTEMRERWLKGDFNTKSEAGRAYGVDESYARRILPDRQAKA